MSGIAGLHGVIAVILLCGLVFVEEAGVPLPLLPGDGMLVACGVLAANHALNATQAVPAIAVAAVAGALLGYGWARAIGRRGLERIAARLRAGALVDRAAMRLRSAGSGGILVCRLLPGLRVYSSLVAGASGMPPRVFVTGLVPAVAVWVTGFVALGYLVGVPAERALTHAQQAALNAGLVLALAAGAYAGLRHVPARGADRDPLTRVRRSWRLVIALLVDAAVVASVTAALTEIVHEALGWGDPDGVVDLEIVVVVVLLAYVAAARLGAGGTAGEGLLDVTYRRAHRAAGS